MQTIVLIMRRRPVAQRLAQKLREEGSLCLVYEPDYAHTGAVIRSQGAHVALIEAWESGDYDVGHCLALCVLLRKETPVCKLLLMCPEQDKAGVARTVEAKRDGRIDDFVFYDSTTDYLVSKLLSL